MTARSCTSATTRPAAVRVTTRQITVDLSRVYAKVDTIVFLVSSYQGHTLEWIDNAYVRLVDVTATRSVELARFTLTGGYPTTGMVMATWCATAASGGCGRSARASTRRSRPSRWKRSAPSCDPARPDPDRLAAGGDQPRQPVLAHGTPASSGGVTVDARQGR